MANYATNTGHLECSRSDSISLFIQLMESEFLTFEVIERKEGYISFEFESKWVFPSDIMNAIMAYIKLPYDGLELSISSTNWADYAENYKWDNELEIWEKQ